LVGILLFDKRIKLVYSINTEQNAFLKEYPTTAEEKRNAYRILMGKPEGRRPLERPRCRWVDNIKIDLR
jgi:hypothetical protein